MRMIFSVALNRLWNLRHDRAAMVLSFVVPIVFFSIFASIFGGDSERSATRQVRLVVVDEDRSDVSRRFVAGLRADPALLVFEAREAKSGSGAPEPFTAASAEAAVRAGEYPAALVVPRGFGALPIRFGPGPHPVLALLADPSDPIAPEVVAGLVQKTVLVAMPDAIARAGMDDIERAGVHLTPEQRATFEVNLEALRRGASTVAPAAAPAAGSGAAAAPAAPTALVEVKRRDVLGEKKKNGMVPFYAAGLGVMFMLFSASGAGAALIEEAESGTLDRILSTRVTMTTLLGGKLLYLAGLAATQLLVMFLWGSIAFGIVLRGHWAGLLVMTVSTALAASTFGLLLAAVSRSRMQLVALSNLLVLVMSALGGSMFPRFLMPEAIQKIGLLTLNAWAIDGFQKVFWREEPLVNLWPQVLVLCAISVTFFAAARRIARRWQ